MSEGMSVIVSTGGWQRAGPPARKSSSVKRSKGKGPASLADEERLDRRTRVLGSEEDVEEEDAEE
jgi:hypothetical protein